MNQSINVPWTMEPRKRRLAAIQFFREHAGFSYTPGKETPEQGRYRCARILAAAERKAYEVDVSFEWREDEDPDRSGIEHDSPLWVCIMRDSKGTVLQYLCGIDFGEDANPWGQPYQRVVEAELASAEF